VALAAPEPWMLDRLVDARDVGFLLRHWLGLGPSQGSGSGCRRSETWGSSELLSLEQRPRACLGSA
jgi:hypothetical protein